MASPIITGFHKIIAGCVSVIGGGLLFIVDLLMSFKPGR